MDKDCFVRIEVPSVDDGGRNRKEPGGITGTGYPVGKNLILTTRHVVRPEKNRDKRFAIRIRWYSFGTWGAKSDGVVELDKDDGKNIVWESDEETDIALIHCPQTPESITPGRFLNRRPTDGDRFDSIGFPRATHFEQGPAQNSFRGEIRVPKEPWFEICDSHAPKSAEDWKGASGMPIFVEGGIVGVFSLSLEDISKGQAIPIQPLLEGNPDFRKWIGYDDQLETEWREYRETVSRDVAEYLERSSGVCDALLRRVHCPAACKPGMSEREARELLSGALLEMEFADFAKLASDLYRKLCAPGGGEEDAAAAPELGIGVSSETISDKIEDHLIRKQMLGKRFDGQAFLDDFDDYLDTTFSPSGRLDRDRGESAQEERDRRNGIDRALARWGRKSRFYLVFRPTDETEYQAMKQTAMVLKDRYRHLLILFLVAFRDDTGENLWDRDADQVFDFCQILPISGTPNSLQPGSRLNYLGFRCARVQGA